MAILAHFFRRSQAVAFGLAAFCGAARSDELAPNVNHGVALEFLRGEVSYTPRDAEFLVVASLGDNSGHSVRFVTALKPGQTTTIMSPGAPGEKAASVELRRDGDRLFVTDHPGQAHDRAEAQALAPDGMEQLWAP